MSTSGRTVTYSATASGLQHRFQALDGMLIAYGLPATMTVSFGDGQVDNGGESGMACTTKPGLNPFSGGRSGKHTYAAAGTYTITVRTQYCGDAGATARTTTYPVTVR